jgi:hypothetical protein
VPGIRRIPLHEETVATAVRDKESGQSAHEFSFRVGYHSSSVRRMKDGQSVKPKSCAMALQIAAQAIFNLCMKLELGQTTRIY